MDFLWWVGNLVFVLVIIVVVVLLQRLVAAVREVGKHVNAIHDKAGGIVVALDAVPALLKTRDLVKQVGGGLARYANAVDRLL